MEIYQLIFQNKEIFKVVYSFVILLISILIVVRAHRFYTLSLHNGLRYFRNAFLFFGLAFASRYLLKFVFDIGSLSHLVFIPIYLFEFFLIVAGFFIIYSLLWKRFEPQGSFSSLFSPITTLFYLMALTITIIDLVWNFYYLLFISQIIIFLYASIISYSNFRRNKGKHKFPRFYFLAMIIVLVAWVLNFLTATIFNWNPALIVNVYILNSLFFLLFLYGIIKVTRR